MLVERVHAVTSAKCIASLGLRLEKTLGESDLFTGNEDFFFYTCFD